MTSQDRLPSFLYGTAWKEDRTESLVTLALQQGFRGIDTANQRKHYFEAAVGQAIQSAIRTGLVSRDELFLQTKYTFQAGQDHRLPYDAAGPIARQVEQSCASSLKHLGVEQIDSYLLHGPCQRLGLSPTDWEAYEAMEKLHDRGLVRHLGVSNVSREQLEEFYSGARVRPRFVQNRCYAALAWDHRVREFCAARGITYQGFSLLTANRDVLMHPTVTAIARRHGRTAAQIVFRFAHHVGMLPLTGTTNPDHMRDDLAALEFSLTEEEVATIERVAVSR